MKTFFITTIAFLVFALTCNAQWTTSGTNIYNSNTGNVGINTITPNYPFHLVHTSTTNDLTTARQFSIGVDASTSYNLSMGYYLNSVSSLWTGVIQTRNNDSGAPLLLNPLGGNVGIGTSFSHTTLQLTAGGNATGAGGAIGFGANDGFNVMAQIKGSLAYSPGGEDQGSLVFYTRPSGVAGQSLTARMIIGPTGQVGIGTNSPDQALTVNGTVHSKSVVVDANIFPDYVFKPTYKLPTLTEVKTYINQNHHLPDVPSATEVEKNGLNLGEMNKVLMQKVEELTLYLIEQNKQVVEQNIQLIKQNTKLADQQKVNQSQQKQIDELKKSLNSMNHKKSN